MKLKTLALACTLLAALPAHAALPALGPMPALPAKQAPDSVDMADARTAPVVKLDLPIAAGPLQPTWESIAQHYPGTPTWLREAKFGIWVHFGPQAAGMSGDYHDKALGRMM